MSGGPCSLGPFPLFLHRFHPPHHQSSYDLSPPNCFPFRLTQINSWHTEYFSFNRNLPCIYPWDCSFAIGVPQPIRNRSLFPPAEFSPRGSPCVTIGPDSGDLPPRTRRRPARSFSALCQYTLGLTFRSEPSGPASVSRREAFHLRSDERFSYKQDLCG